MNYGLNSFLQQITGNWMSHKTTYYINSKKICVNQFKNIVNNNQYSIDNESIHAMDQTIYSLECVDSDKKDKESLIFIPHDIHNSGSIKRNKNHNLYHYQYFMYTKNCLKVQHNKNDIKYTEYIYNINSKFTTSIGFLKKSNKYIAISFLSKIKMKEHSPK